MKNMFYDIAEAFRRFPLAVLLGWRDTVSAHRRSLVGPIWIFVQTFLWVFFIGILFSGMLGEESTVDYLVYVAIGMVVFNLMTLMIADASTTFIREASLIKNIPVPPSTYVMRVGTKAIFTLMFEFPIIIIAFAVTGFWPSLANVGWATLALAFTVFSFMGAAFALAALAARIQDIIPAISVGNRLAFFATPIFWIRDSADPVREFLGTFNPLSHYMKIIRAPLIETPWSSTDWIICAALCVVFWIIGLLSYGSTRDKLAALV